MQKKRLLKNKAQEKVMWKKCAGTRKWCEKQKCTEFFMRKLKKKYPEKT